ncbi:MAG: MAPEG family protein [Rhizobiaceae bacterium]|nr:MAPEG family protein [Rhizobiaceae bacterium]
MDWLAASPLPSFPAEVAYLVLAIALLGVHVAVQAILLTREHGPDYNAGPRDENRPVRGVAGRAERALRNFLETFPAFAALAILHVTMDKGQDWWTGFGAALYFWSRVVYLPLYLAGVKTWRSLVFLVSSAGLVILFVRLVF